MSDEYEDDNTERDSGLTSYNPDGSITYTDPDGSTYTYNTNGTVTGGSGSNAWTYNPTTGMSNYDFSFGNLLKTLGGKLTGMSGRDIAGLAGGLYGLYQANQPQQKAGYQGGIPNYTAVRERVPTTYDATRRPGSSGQQYFTAPQFAKKDDATAVTAARAAAIEQATALANANATNPARQTLPTSTAVTSPAGGGTAAGASPRAASSVIQDLKVPVYTAANASGVKMASGGLASMAKGRYLGGTTDGMADKIPARIGDTQEARLSHGEFVIPADVVSHLGNGNSEAGAQRLYAMMDKIRTARTGTKKQGKQIDPDKFLA
jgi:hypothetical protein